MIKSEILSKEFLSYYLNTLKKLVFNFKKIVKFYKIRQLGNKEV